MNQSQVQEELIFDNARKIADRAEREAYLKEACGDDAQLYQRLCKLLEANSIDDSFLERTNHTDVSSSSQESIGTIIGPYKLREQIGEGGMGIVYVAEQEKPVRRKVALKIIKPGMDTKQVIARFEAERQALAMMSHPNIAKVFDGGVTETGRPYFVMELVRGIPITEFCDQQKLGIRERLKLFSTVCQAVQHAHIKGIIHRDLKPSNVMIERHDVVDVPKVIDFGVAKAVNEKLSDNTVYTVLGQMIGTPMYMSPEQAELSGLDIDTRTDVYSLGVLLYELLTGSPPFDKEVFKKASFDEIRRIIREDEPTKPSASISTIKADLSDTHADNRCSTPRVLTKHLHGELDWIVMRSLEKDRNRRYDSASAFADDIQRYLKNEPVEACPPSRGYRLQKFTKRNKAFLTTVSLLLGTMFVGMAVSFWYADKANESATQLKASLLAAEIQSSIANELAIKSELTAKELRKANIREASQRTQAEEAQYLSDVRLSESLNQYGSHSEALNSLSRHYPNKSGNDYRAWEWYYLIDQANQSLLSWQASRGNISSIDWSSDGKHIAITSDYSPGASIWDADTGEVIERFPDGRTLKKIVEWHPQGHQLAWGSASDESAIRVWDENSGEIKILSAHCDSVWDVSWSHTGDRLVVGAIPQQDPLSKQDSRNLILWSNDDGEWHIRARTTIPKNINSTVWNHDDSLIAVASDVGNVGIYASDTLELIRQTPKMKLCRVAWCPDHNILAAGIRNSGECIIFDGDEMTEQTRFTAHLGEIRHLEWSRDGKYLATCGADGLVKIWDTLDWSLNNKFSGHSGMVNQVSWGPRSKRIASAGYDGIINIWPITNKTPHFELDSREKTSGNRFTWTSEHLIRTISRSTMTMIDRDPHTGKIKRTLDVPKGSDESWRLIGKNFVLRNSKEGDKATYDVAIIDSKNEDAKIISLPRLKGERIKYATKVDETHIAVNLGSYGRTILLDILEGRERNLGDERFIVVNQMAWSAKRNALAIIGKGVESDDGNPKYSTWLHLVDVATGKDISHTQVGKNRVAGTAVAWSPNSEQIAVATEDGLCEIFDSQHQRKLVSSRNHRTKVNSLSWHPLGNRIASGGIDQNVNIWDSRTGKIILKIPVNEAITHVEWSSNGMMLAAQTASGKVRVWDATAGYSFVESKGFKEQITRRVFESFLLAYQKEDSASVKQHGVELINRDDFYIHFPYYILGLSSVVTDDNAQYIDTCQKMVKQFENSVIPIELNFTAWTCALAPNALEDYDPAIKLARHAVKKEPGNKQYLDGLGAILMRAGQYDAAKVELDKALAAGESDNTSSSYIRYFLAITEHYLGHQQAAQDQLLAANEAATKELEDTDQPPAWNRKLTLELLRKEAEALTEKTDQ